MKLYIVALALACTLPLAAKRKGSLHHSRHTTATDTTAKPRLSEYDKSLQGAQVQKGFINIVRKGGQIFLDIPDSLVGRDLLLGARVAAISNNKTISAGQRRNNPILFSLRKEEKRLIMVTPISNSFVLPTDPMAQSVLSNNALPAARYFDITATSKGRLLVDVTKYFTDEVAEVWPPDLSKLGKPDSKMGGIRQARAFSKNLEITTDYYYTSGRDPFFLQMHYSLLLLPEAPARERFDDDRIGYMNSVRKVYRSEQPIQSRRIISRFRIEPRPEDRERYLQGETVEPAQPILFYVDTVMPAVWRKYARQGIEQWNVAFEKIGFRNVIRAVDFPKDPKFSAFDISNNCLHYVATDTENATGPCWIDPRSGEIIQADILLYHGVFELLKRWRFLQTAAADPKARSSQYDEEMMGELIRYAVSHEMGHCLGLQHNMRASYAYPVDSLRSPSFTAKYGTTASIMDYARNNHVAQVGDAQRGVRMTPPALGPFDFLSIEYGYRYYPDSLTQSEELALLNSLFSSKGNDPMYQYGPMTAAQIFPDPASQSDALGNDLIKSGDYAIKNLQYIMQNLTIWHVEEGENYTNLNELVEGIHRQFMRHLSLAASYIGGIHTHQIAAESHVPRFEAVPAAKQREAVQYIFKHLRSANSWLMPSDITQRIGSRNENITLKASELIEVMTGALILPRFTSCSELNPQGAYSIGAYFSDMQQELFVKGTNASLSEIQKSMQYTFIQRMILLADINKTDKDAVRNSWQVTAASEALHTLRTIHSRLGTLIGAGGSNTAHYRMLQSFIKL